MVVLVLFFGGKGEKTAKGFGFGGCHLVTDACDS